MQKANRDAAREKARQMRDAQDKSQARKRMILVGSTIAVALLCAASVAVIVASTAKPARPGPLNMASDGIVIGKDLIAQPTAAVQSGEKPVASTSSPGVTQIRVYFDYLCPFCGQFEEVNEPQLHAWITSGSATVEYHPLALFDRASQGTKYSTRSANAAACVANYSPNHFWAFNQLMFKNQPQELTAGLDNVAIKDLLAQSSAEDLEKINLCVDDGDFSSWASAATSRALQSSIPGTGEELTGTPLILVNGQVYKGQPSDPVAFAAFVAQVSGL